jgi:tripartite motif-containing protein 71
MRPIRHSLALISAIAALALPLVAQAQSLSPSPDPDSVWVEIGAQANATVGLEAWPDGKSYFMGGSMWGGNDVTTDGSFYVVNAGSSEVWHTGEYAEPIARWGQKGTGPGQFDFVRDPATTDGLAFGGVATSPLGGPFGNVYVADSGNQRMQEFDHNGVFIRQWGGTGTDDGLFMDPIDVAVGPTGLVYVADDIRDDIQVFSTEGSFMSKVGGHGSGDGHLDHAGSVFVGPDGTLYAADSGNGRVQAWGPDGTFLWSFGSTGIGYGQFDHPSDVGVDAAGNIYVVDRHRLQIFGPDRTHLATWTAPSPPMPTPSGAA